MLKSGFEEGVHRPVRMETREPNTSRATLTELARFAYCRGEVYRKLQDEERQERQAEVTKEKNEARKAR